jgi:hypothetical protein
MKYSLRSLLIAVLVLPPLLAWGALPLYRWLTTPKAPEPTEMQWVSDIMPPPTSSAPVPASPQK